MYFKSLQEKYKKKDYNLLKKNNVVLYIQMCVYPSKVPKSEPYTAICEWGESTGKQVRALWYLQLNYFVLTLLYAVNFNNRPLECATALCMSSAVLH